MWGALSGMEVTLAALLVTGALLADSRSRPWMAGTLLGLAALSRPEAILMAPLIWIGGPLTAGRAAALAVPLTLLLAPWAAFNLERPAASFPPPPRPRWRADSWPC